MPRYSEEFKRNALALYEDNEALSLGLCQILWTGKPVVFGCGG